MMYTGSAYTMKCRQRVLELAAKPIYYLQRRRTDFADILLDGALRSQNVNENN